MNKIIAGLIALYAMGFGPAFGQALVVTDPTVESPFYGRLDLQYQKTKNKDEQLSLFGKILYGEYLVTEKVSVTGTVYHDKEFRGVYAGLAYQATDELQLGLATGRVKYDDRDWTVWNPWVYFERDAVKASLYSEYTKRDTNHPWFVKGYVEYKLGEKYFLGIYGESFLGVGPMVGTYLTEKIRLWAMIPVADKANMRAMAGISVEF